MASPFEEADLIQEVVEREGVVLFDRSKETNNEDRIMVAGYVHGSSQTCEAQMNAIRARFDKKADWDSLTFYIDEGRAGFGVGLQGLHAAQRLIDDARASNLDVIVVYRNDRLARDGSLFVQICEELQDLDIEFVSLTKGRLF